MENNSKVTPGFHSTTQTAPIDSNPVRCLEWPVRVLIHFRLPAMGKRP